MNIFYYASLPFLFSSKLVAGPDIRGEHKNRETVVVINDAADEIIDIFIKAGVESVAGEKTVQLFLMDKVVCSFDLNIRQASETYSCNITEKQRSLALSKSKSARRLMDILDEHGAERIQGRESESLIIESVRCVRDFRGQHGIKPICTYQHQI
jgi:hypothetical protein